MPLSKFSTYFCQQASEPALEILPQWYNTTLHSISIVDAFHKISQQQQEQQQQQQQLPCLLSADDPLGRVDPLIMIAWKCQLLRSVTLIGYQYSDVGLVGIARLCGPKLRQLNIPELCVDYEAAARKRKTWNSLCKSVSEALQRKWRPMKTAELDGAIVDPALHGWDSYVLGRLN